MPSPIFPNFIAMFLSRKALLSTFRNVHWTLKLTLRNTRLASKEIGIKSDLGRNEISGWLAKKSHLTSKEISGWQGMK
jgi:hypothetical protein